MRVIKHGLQNPCKETCKRCQCIFEYDGHDVQKDTDDVCGTPFHFVDCPECRKQIIVQWPPYIPADDSRY